MSNLINDALYASFMDSLTEVNVCPYCGTQKEQGDACCKEVHDETMWDNGKELIAEDELDAAFAQYLKRRGEA